MVLDARCWKMFRYENALPKLPLPQLQDTAERYLHSIKPFVKDSEYECSKQAVEDFVRPGSLGQDVQEQLRARAHDPAIHNWLHEWWTEMYLSSRASLFPSPYYYNR